MFLFVSPTQQTTAPNPITPPQPKDPTQTQCFVFNLFPQPNKQLHPIPLLNSFLPTPVQGPNPNSVFLFVSPTPKSTAPNPIIGRQLEEIVLIAFYLEVESKTKEKARQLEESILFALQLETEPKSKRQEEAAKGANFD